MYCIWLGNGNAPCGMAHPAAAATAGKKKGKRTNVRRDFTREMFLYILIYIYMSGVWSIFREPSECFAGAVAAESKK